MAGNRASAVGPALKSRALALADEIGPSEAARRLGIKPGTLAAWRSRDRREGTDLVRVSPQIAETMENVATEQWSTRVNGMADAYGQMAAEALAASRDLLKRGRVMDAKGAMLTSAIAADKAQLLSGQATSRSESRTVHSAEVGARLAAVLASVRAGNGLGIRRETLPDQGVYAPAEGEVVVDADVS